MDEKQLSLLDDHEQADNGPVVCLGMTFKNDEERREYFRNELRKKLPELKKIEGFPIGDDEDIIALSDPPYYTACPNPWINDFIEEWEREKKEKYGRDEDEEYHREPFAADVSEGKNDPIYNAHSYHTKVPHRAIMRYILHYTQPGDIVFDGFCGTGMAGVAAQLCGNRKEVEELGYKVEDNGNIFEEINGELHYVSQLGTRHAIVSDISPIATFISYNYNNSANISRFKEKSNEIINKLEDEYGWIYTTLRKEHSKKAEELLKKNFSIDALKEYIRQNSTLFAKINYVVWSDILYCPNCLEQLTFWDISVDQKTYALKETMSCPYCQAIISKNKMERSWETIYDEEIDSTIKVIKRVPILINYSIGNKRFEKKPDEFDHFILKKIKEIKIPARFPTDRIPNGDKTREPIRLGLTHTHHFYTKRNLLSLSLLWEESNKEPLLKLSLTSIIIKTASLLHNIGLKKGKINLAGALPNTLYVPSNLAERNIFELLRGKINDLVNAQLERLNKNNIVSCIPCSEIEKMGNLESSVDYIFIDPPFGANLMYSELNFLWESWLGVKTNNTLEAIENKTQNKKLSDYHKLMTDAFKTCYKLLKPGKWMTVEFSNTRASVWNVIQNAIQEAGFIIANVSALNKGQGTFNSQTNPTSVKQDLVITAYKPSVKITDFIKNNGENENIVWLFLEEHLKKLPVFVGSKGQGTLILERTPRILFDRMVAYHVQNGLPVPISSAEFQAKVAQRFPMRDGMVFLESQVAEYDKKRTLVKEFVQMSLFVTDETSAIEWLRQQLLKKPQTRQDLHPNFMKEIQHIAKHEKLPELDDLLEQNFLKYEGDGPVPDQIASYLRRNYKDLRGLENDDPQLKEKAMNRWYVPDPNKQADLEKLREKALLREFEGYVEELSKSKKKLKQFRTEAIRAGFKKAWSEKDYETIVKVGERLPENVIQEDDKLLMYYDNAQIRLGM